MSLLLWNYKKYCSKKHEITNDDMVDVGEQRSEEEMSLKEVSNSGQPMITSTQRQEYREFKHEVQTIQVKLTIR